MNILEIRKISGDNIISPPLSTSYPNILNKDNNTHTLVGDLSNIASSRPTSNIINKQVSNG